MTKYVYFGYSKQGGLEPYAFDSEYNTINLLLDINAGEKSSVYDSPQNLVISEGLALFAATDDAHGTELWASNGSPNGTYLIRDIAYGIRSGLSATGSISLTAAGNGAFFAATTIDTGNELWYTDGTNTGTHLVTDLNPGSANSSPTNIKSMQKGVVFNSSDVGGFYYAQSSGIVKINSLPTYYYDTSNGYAYYATSINGNYEFHRFDEAYMHDNIVFGSNSFGIHSILNVYSTNGIAFFTAEMNDGSNQLWTSDGSAEDTRSVINFGSKFINFGLTMNTFNGHVLITAGFGLVENWISDGTAGGTFKLPNSSSIFTQSVHDGKLYYTEASSGSSSALWTTDGTPGGTHYIRSENYLKLLGFDGPDLIISYQDNSYKSYLDEISQSGATLKHIETAAQIQTLGQISITTTHGKNALVDDVFYFGTSRDVLDAHLDAASHYNSNGWHEGRDPNAFFSTNGYLAANQDVAKAGINPLTHYDAGGWKEGRDPSATFDNELYLLHNPDVKAADIDPLAHFLQFGQAEGRQAYAAIGNASSFTHGSFDAEYYLLANPDVAKAALAAGGDTFAFAYQHYETYGSHEGRTADAYFDPAYYLAQNPDVAAAGIDPLTHYDLYGWKEGRDPSAAFHTNAYLAANPDVAAAHIDPLLHYLQNGALEGRHLA